VNKEWKSLSEIKLKIGRPQDKVNTGNWSYYCEKVVVVRLEAHP